MDEAAHIATGASEVIFKAQLEKVWTPLHALLWIPYAEHLYHFFNNFTTLHLISLYIS